MIGDFFPNAVVQAMALLDECADDMEMAQMFVQTQLRGEGAEDLWWGEVLEALRGNQRNEA